VPSVTKRGGVSGAAPYGSWTQRAPAGRPGSGRQAGALRPEAGTRRGMRRPVPGPLRPILPAPTQPDDKAPARPRPGHPGWLPNL